MIQNAFQSVFCVIPDATHNVKYRIATQRLCRIHSAALSVVDDTENDSPYVDSQAETNCLLHGLAALLFLRVR